MTDEAELIAGAEVLLEAVNTALRKALPEIPEALLRGVEVAASLVTALNDEGVYAVPEAIAEQGVMLPYAVALLNLLWDDPEMADTPAAFAARLREEFGDEEMALFFERLTPDDSGAWQYVPIGDGNEG